MANSAERIFCAVDTPDLDQALNLAKTLKGTIGGLKLGLEFYSAQGPDGVAKIAKAGLPVFLDLKLHDIPNTVEKAVCALAPLGVKMLTIHASGGVQMMRAAREAACLKGSSRPLILGVTVLTSLDLHDLHALGISSSPADQVITLAGLAQAAGLDGVVCSPHEIEALKKKYGKRLTLVVPGIRPEGAPTGDQKRVMTPKQAVDLGADYLVIGRPITGAGDPRKAAAAIAESLENP